MGLHRYALAWRALAACPALAIAPPRSVRCTSLVRLFGKVKSPSPIPSASARRRQAEQEATASSDLVVPTTSPETAAQRYSSSYHTPVMVNEVLQTMFPATALPASVGSPFVLVDGTLGGGGHSLAFLELLLRRYHSGSMPPSPSPLSFVVIGVDRDPIALAFASERLKPFLDSGHFLPHRSNFADLTTTTIKTLLEGHGKRGHDVSKILERSSNSPATTNSYKVDALFLDLGVSSSQIDDASRGFSYSKPGPLDMRMGVDPSLSSPTAASLCNSSPASDLASLMTTYGDESPSRARRIADSIVSRRPLSTTADLVACVAAVVPTWNKGSRRLGLTPTLSRVFQSFRIAVNDEEAALARALRITSPRLLVAGGTFAALTYHSNEDRIVKRVMRGGGLAEASASISAPASNAAFEPVNIKGIKASEREVEFNVRARSATLRVAKRTDAEK